MSMVMDNVMGSETANNRQELLRSGEVSIGNKVDDSDVVDYIDNDDDTDEVDVSKLDIGMVVRNYKELCQLLAQTPKTGNARKAQLRMWNRYFNWERSGKKYIITEIYDIPLPEELRCDAMFAKYIETQLVLALAQQPEGVFCFTDSTIYKALNMVGSDYDLLKTYESTVNELKKINNEVSWYGMWLLRSQAKAKLRRILDNALESMKKRSLIVYKRENAVVHSEGEDPVSATDQEDKMILEAQQVALRELGYEILPAVINSKESSNFYRRVNEYLHDNYGIFGAFPWIKIIYKRPYYMDEVVERVKEQYSNMALEYYDSRKQLNESVVDAFYKMIKRSNKRAIKVLKREMEDSWSMGFAVGNSKNSIKSSPQYLFDGEAFIEKYIKSELEGRNDNDWVFKLDVNKFLES